MKASCKIIEMLNVKSIVTLALTAVFSVQSLRGVISAGQFHTVFTTVIAFYFGTQYRKKTEDDK